MNRLQYLKSALVGGASVLAIVHPATAKEFDIPDGDLAVALNTYMQESGMQIMYLDAALRGHRSPGARGDYTEIAALSQVLQGTGFTTRTLPGNIISIVPQERPVKLAQAAPKPAPKPAPAQSGVETVVVTAQKKSEDIQNVPIAVSAFSQEQLKEEQVAGGPDLVKEVPNLTFSKTNFSGYNLEIRGIGTQAVSVTTDPAVAVAFNDTPFIRNHFFEQEFYDLQDAEVLRGPQGTLYGRNATAGVVNIKSALPTDQFESMASVDVGNYNGRRMEAMVNLPIVGDTLDIRVAGEWTVRDGYTYDTTTNSSVDGRDLWSGRMTIGWKPISDLQTYFVWEHFSEDDDRLRSGKALCTTDPGPSSVPGPLGAVSGFGGNVTNIDVSGDAWLSQGCLPGSLYSPSAYGVPNPGVIPFVQVTEYLDQLMPTGFNPYGTLSQSPNLRQIGSSILPHYMAKNDTLEFNANYQISPSLTLTSQTGYNNDFLYSTEDYNRFNTVPDAFTGTGNNNVGTDLEYCDPQLGCSTQFLAEDLSQEHSEQFYQEVRLASNDSGPLNFNVGANYLYYSTVEDYYVFSNLLSWFQENLNQVFPPVTNHIPFNGAAANACSPVLATPNFNFNTTSFGLGCGYVDPNPLGQINGQGHNYFRSENPYVLNSWAAFGETYYQVAPDVKLTGGLRFTDDMKHFTEIPSQTLIAGEGYPVTGVLNQQWEELTGRFNATWTPTLDFTDQSLFYASYSRGYKGGGANPPGVVPITIEDIQIESPSNYTHPLTFKPEFINAYELGTKNSLLDDSMTLNGDIFYYKYWDYQISSIVDRTAINQNFNTTAEGAELESTWEPLPGLRFNFAGGLEDSALAKGSRAIDLMDRTAGMPGWMVVRPYPTQTSNCILPTYVVNELIYGERAQFGGNNSTSGAGANPTPSSLYFNGDYNFGLDTACLYAYSLGLDPGIGSGVTTGYVPGNPQYAASNDGQGFFKNLSGNKLPNMPPFTLSFGSQYSLPVSADWVGTLRGDFYWQGNTEARVFNDKPYDSIHGYSTLNLALVFDNQDGWQAMFYVKNVFDVTAITGDFLNSDDTGLTTNVFLTDPRLFGVRITKKFDAAETQSSDHGGPLDMNLNDMLDISDTDGGKPPLWIELGGQFALLDEGQQRYAPPFVSGLFYSGPGAIPPFTIPHSYPATLPSPLSAQKLPGGSFDWNGKLSFQPDGSDWVFSAAVRYGRSSNSGHVQKTFRTPTAAYGESDLADYVISKSYEQEIHTVLDFMAGKDVGLGMFGTTGTSVLSGGVRIAQFASSRTTNITADPDAHYVYGHPARQYNDVFKGAAQAKHSFHGIGPTISWDASTPIAGNTRDGEITVDWGANAAMLFGRRTAEAHHQTSQCHRHGTFPTCHSVYNTHGTIARSRQVTVPNLGGFAGISMRYNNAKVSFGYRADEFFGAMDGGFANEKTTNLGFFGPFANISIGLGG